MKLILPIMALLALNMVQAQKSSQDKEILLVLEVARHGARSPGTIYPFTLNPGDNFNDTNELTADGKKQHFDIGTSLRKKYIEDTPFLSKNYNPIEIYTQCTFLNRTYDSAVSQLQGLYPQPEDDKNNYYLINQISQDKDLLTHVKHDNCQKEDYVYNDVKGSADYKQINSYFEQNYKSKLENLIGWSDITFDDMDSICSYIYWAQMDNLALNFTPSVEDNNYCAALGDSKEYTVSYGIDELWHLGSWEFAQQLLEFATHLLKNTRIDDMPHFKKYYSLMFGQQFTASRHFPKMIIYLAHAETIFQYFDGLGFHHYARPPPAATIFFEFFRKEGKIYVEMTYQQDLTSVEYLKFPNQVENYIEIHDFIDSIEKRFAQVDIQDMVQECQESYTSTHKYYDGTETLNAFIQMYDLVSLPNTNEMIQNQ